MVAKSFAPSASDFQNQGECLAGPLTANQFGVGIRYSASIIDGALALDDVQAMSNARNLVSQVESCYTDAQDYRSCTSTGATPGLKSTGLNIVDGMPANGGEVGVPNAASDSYTVVAKSKSFSCALLVLPARRSILRLNRSTGLANRCANAVSSSRPSTRSVRKR